MTEQNQKTMSELLKENKQLEVELQSFRMAAANRKRAEEIAAQQYYAQLREMERRNQASRDQLEADGWY